MFLAPVAAPGGTGGTFPSPNKKVLELRERKSIVKKFEIFVKLFQIFIKIFLKTFKILKTTYFQLNYQNLSKL